MGIRQSGVPEAEVFLTTKLEREDYGYHAAHNGLEGSLQRLGLKKIDLYLIHSPEFDPGARVETWRALTELSRSERLVSVGVSNFEIQHLEELARAGLAVPSVNQIELHPFNYTQRRELVDYCQQRGIVVMAYSPLGVGEYLSDPRLAEIAARVHQTPARVLLRWGLQHNFVVIPKASREDHIRENLGAFDFTLADDLMQQLDEF
jgi:diketogulonate reductase-like aldo/keto reductase